MDAIVGNLAHPSVEVGLQCRPTLKTTTGNRVLLHIPDATLVLALGAGPIRCTGPRPKTPMLGEGMQPRVEFDFACQPVMVGDQPAIVVEQYLFGNPAEVAESALQTGKPAFLALIAKRPEHSSRRE